MRPLDLELEGFAAFRERTTVDFRDADLFAIVGATGHGKSSLIDAVAYELRMGGEHQQTVRISRTDGRVR